MPPTIVPNVVDTLTILSNRKIIDMDPEIAKLEPDTAPLMTFLMRQKRRPAKSQLIEWLEDEYHPRYTNLTASYTNVATVVNVTAGTGAYFKAGDIIRNELTGENMSVTSVATDALTVTRPIGAVASVASSGAADGIIRIANASEEGALLVTPKHTKQTRQTNYCQIVRTSLAFTNTLTEHSLYGGEEPEREIQKKGFEHKMEWEHILWMGQRVLQTGGTHPRAITGGVVDYSTTMNIDTIGGNLTQTLMETFLRDTFRYGSNNKVLFASPLIMSALASFPLGKLAPPSPGINKWGVSLSSYQSSLGDSVKIVSMREWSDFSTTSPAFGGSAFLLDLDYFEMRPLRSTKYLPNRQANDEDSIKAEYLTEAGFAFKQERAHGWLRGVTGYA